MIELNTIKKYVGNNKERFINELFALLEVPSISAQPAYKKSMKQCAEKVATLLQEAGMPQVNIFETEGAPCVYGELIKDKALPTVLVYGHYDVQPPDPLELWTSSPFEPVLKNGKIFARGSADDKGQFMMHIKAIELMIKHAYVPCNIKIIIEGEEEVGSPSLDSFVKKNADLLACDVILISDSAMHSIEQPTIDIGTRGLAYLELELTGPDHDLHSGIYGGAVPNPIHILCKMIASLHNEHNQINIPHFYDKVANVSSKERALLSKLPYNEKAFLDETGCLGTWGESGFSTNERTGIRPTLEINGIWGGYIQEGAKTVLPSKAYAKISCRLVPNQTTEEISILLERYFQSIAPRNVAINIKHLHGGNPYITPIDSPAYQAAAQAIETTFGKKPLPKRGGGSIPIVALFESYLEVKTVFLGFGLNDDNLHSPNEKFNVENFVKGIETIPYFYAYFVERTAKLSSV